MKVRRHLSHLDGSPHPGAVRQDQAEAAAAELLEVELRERRLALVRVGDVLDARARAPYLPDPERVRDDEDPLGRILGAPDHLENLLLPGAERQEDRARPGQ